MSLFVDYENPTKEMVEWFDKRTKRHISLVNKYYKKFYNFIEVDPPRNILTTHDASKLVEPERLPYIWITWQYYCNEQNIPFDNAKLPNLNANMNIATNHHVKNNPHHPEYWTDRTDNLIPETNRDKFDPFAIPTIDASMMPQDYLVELCADWCAMSEEKSTDPFDWFNKVVNKRWSFGDEKTKFIYDVLKSMWE